MATMTSTEPIQVHPRETAITLCLVIAKECFKLQAEKPAIAPNDPAYNAWWIVRRTAETFKEHCSLELSGKHRADLGEALFTYHSLTCKTAHWGVCGCEAATLIKRLNSVLEG